MVAIRLNGHITEDGKLEIDLPAGLPAGDVQVLIELSQQNTVPEASQTLTREEIQELMRIELKSSAELVKQLEEEGGWENLDISSGAEWVDEQHRKNQRSLPRW